MAKISTHIQALIPWVLLLAAPAAAAPDALGKVDPWLLDRLGKQESVEFLVFLRDQADLGEAASFSSKAERGRWVVDRLRETAARTQPPVLDAVRSRGLEHRAFWVANAIWVRGDAEAVAELAARPDVAAIDSNPEVALDVLYPAATGVCPVGGVEPNLVQAGAPEVWAQGFTGQGAVVAGADTGYDWDHPALRDQYRGWNGSSASHDYNWHDAIHSGGSMDCGSSSPEPCDDNNHGTHTMGTMVGDDGAGNRFGMAPGARWIGCRNMNEGAGTPATYTECFQFFIAPTDSNDQNPLPAMAPDVINGSWSCPGSEGCTDPNVLLAVVENVRAAGIVVVQSAGNGGSGCSSVNTPAAIYEATFSVGAVDQSDNIAGFSSRGPVTVDSSGRRKPDVSAPGTGICSTIRGGGYSDGFSGTSMSAPHVAGLVALLISARPSLAGDPDAIEAHVEATALPRTTTQTCGGDGPSDVPNNTYGYGSIRAVVPWIFANGFELGSTAAWDVVVP